MGQKIYESDKFLKTGGTSSQYLMADGTTSTGPDTGVDVGTGTANKVAKFSDSDTITDSTITDDGTSVGIGTDSPDANLHIFEGSAGTFTPATSYDEFLIESDQNAGMTIASPDNRVSGIAFGTPSDSNGAYIQWDYTNSLMSIGTAKNNSDLRFVASNNSEVVRMLGGGNVGIGTDSPSYKLEVDGTFLASGNSTIQGRTDLEKDLIIRGTDALANQGVARFYVDSSNNLFIDTANNGANLFTIEGTNGNVGIGTTSPDSPIHISETDTNYDVARGVHVEITKDHTNTTGWGASLFGVRSTVQNDGVGKLTDLQAGRFQAEHIGTGVSYYLLGSQSKGIHNGSGNTGVIWGAFNAGQITGTGTGTHPYLIGTNQKAELDNANASVGNMAGIISAAKTTAGDVTGRIDGAWIELDCNQGAATTVDANVLYLKAQTGNLTASGTIRTIHSTSTHPSEFAGTIEATEFIVTGATSQRFLKGDGSLDSTTYNSGAGTSGGVAIYDGTNTTTDDANLQWNFPSSKLTITGDLDVTADIQVDNITVTSKVEAGSFAVDALNTAPSTASSTGTLGEIRVTSDYIYVCVATDTWKRTSLTTWGFTP